ASARAVLSASLHLARNSSESSIGARWLLSARGDQPRPSRQQARRILSFSRCLCAAVVGFGARFRNDRPVHVFQTHIVELGAQRLYGGGGAAPTAGPCGVRLDRVEPDALRPALSGAGDHEVVS